jgi:hypothetical protein
MIRTKKQLPTKPFFTRFLEEQKLDQVAGGQTLKYPSDSDEEEPGGH